MVNKNLLLGKIVSCGYNQRDAARNLGISENTFGAKLNGKRPFDTEQIVKLCEFLNITDCNEKVRIFLSQTSQFRDDRLA